MTGHSGARGRQHKQRNEATAPTAQRVLKEQVPTRVSSTSAKNRLLKQQGVGRTSNHIKAEENQQLNEWENQHLNHLDIQIGQHTDQNDEDDVKDDMTFSRDLLTKLPELEVKSSPQMVPNRSHRRKTTTTIVTTILAVQGYHHHTCRVIKISIKSL